MTPTNAAARRYTARVNRVVDHIAAHLAEPLDLARLAAVAHFSPFHFHRVFQAVAGETLADCVRRLRLEAAAQRLLERPQRNALAIALEVGFQSAPVFTRAFAAHFGSTPSAWRRGEWRAWAATHRDALRKIHQATRKAHQAAELAFRNDPLTWPTRPLPEHPVDTATRIENLPALRLAYLRHTGPYGHPGIPQTWERFGAWCAAEGLLQPRPRMYGLSLDNPQITPPERCRYDCAIAVPAGFQPRGDIGVEDFAGGRHACTPFRGTADTIHAAWVRVFGEWLPSSGWQPADGPAVEIYEPDYAIDPETGVFACLLAVPVRPA